MRRTASLLLLLVFGCAERSARSTAPADEPATPTSAPSAPGARPASSSAAAPTDDVSRVQFRPDLVPALRSAGFDGVFAYSEAGADTVWCVGDERCTRRFAPASTFKVPHALIGLDAGVLEGPHHYIAWDGKKRWRASWNQSHTLASAMRESVVWYFQHVARELGRERLARGLATLDYGNRRMSDAVDEFWLDGSLAISPVEQVRFWHALHDGRFAVAPSALRQVLAITEVARQSNVVLRGKTGWSKRPGDDAQHGWFTGCLDGPRRVCFAALLFPTEPFEFEDAARARLAATRAVLGELGYMVP